MTKFPESPQAKKREKDNQARKDNFNRQLDNGSMVIRQMTKAEREKFGEAPKEKPKRTNYNRY